MDNGYDSCFPMTIYSASIVSSVATDGAPLAVARVLSQPYLISGVFILGEPATVFPNVESVCRAELY